MHERIRALRGRRPAVDHAVRAYDRNSEVQGGQLAAVAGMEQLTAVYRHFIALYFETFGGTDAG